MINYTKGKPTDGFSYKDVTATIQRAENCFIINVFPYFNFTGIYTIISSKKKLLGTTVFRTMKSDEENPNLDLLSIHNEFFISISPNGKRVSIYKSNLEGIMLKY